MADFEKKNDIVLDENGSAIDKDGNKKEKLLADYMTKKDVLAMISEFSQSFNEALAALDKVASGASFTDASDALSRLMTVVSGGTHVDFARKNAWIADPAQRNSFLTSGVDQGIADKQFIIDFYKLVVGTANLRASFGKFLTLCSSDYLFTAYLAARFDNTMKEIVKSGDVSGIVSSFAEFFFVYKRFNDAAIFKEIPVSKSKYSPEENLEMVLDYMDEAICQKPHLGKFMLGAKKASPSTLNQLYIYDRETAQFDRFASREGTLQNGLNSSAELDAMLAGAYALCGDGMLDYLNGYRKVLEKLAVLFTSALDIIKAYKTEKSKAPYSIMHYDPLVKEAVSQMMLGSLSEPLTEGTNYREMAQAMVARCQSLAKTVARSAPN